MYATTITIARCRLTATASGRTTTGFESLRLVPCMAHAQGATVSLVLVNRWLCQRLGCQCAACSVMTATPGPG